MLQNMKIPHWAMVALTIIGVVLTWLAQQQQLGAIVLPAWAASLVTLLLVVLGALGVGSTSVSPQANLRAARLAKLVPPILVLGFALILAACSPGAVSPSAILTDEQFVTCVAADVIAQKKIGAILGDCGRDIPAIVAQVWGLISGNGLAANPYASTPAALEVRAIRDTVTGRTP